MDAITMLRNDHKTVEGLFKKFEKAGEGAVKTKQDLVADIITELAAHAHIEEQVFYPAVRKAVPDVEDTVLEGLEEHHIVKTTLSELETMTPDDERFQPKVTVLIESVRHHVKEEEEEMFPEVRKALGRKLLAELGEEMDQARQTAPATADPEAPDEPATPPRAVSEAPAETNGSEPPRRRSTRRILGSRRF